MPDLSNAEISVEGEYGECLVCGESFHWTQLTNTQEGLYCDDHVGVFGDFSDYFVADDELRTRMRVEPCDDHVDGDDEADMGHDTALERDTFGDAL